MLRHLSQLTEEPESLEMAAPNAVECLRKLVRRYPSVKKWAYDKDGKLLPLIRFYVNGQEVPSSEFAKPLKEDDDLHGLLCQGMMIGDCRRPAGASPKQTQL